MNRNRNDSELIVSTPPHISARLMCCVCITFTYDASELTVRYVTFSITDSIMKSLSVRCIWVLIFRAQFSSRAWYLIRRVSKWYCVVSSGPRTCRATRSTATLCSWHSNKLTWYRGSRTSTTHSSRSAPPHKVRMFHTRLTTRLYTQTIAAKNQDLCK